MFTLSVLYIYNCIYYSSCTLFINFCFVLFNFTAFINSELISNSYYLSCFFSPVSSLLLVFFCIYFFSLFCLLLNLKNILISLLLVELTYFGVICSLLSLAVFFDFVFGFTFALLVILVAAAESVIGLGLAILVFRFQRIIMYDSLASLHV